MIYCKINHRLHIIVSASESETKSEEKLEKTQPEKESLEESERIPEELIKQSILELIPESAKPSKSAESINSAESTKFVKEIEAETKSALEVELMKELESVSMQEFIQESIQESGSVPETEPIIAQESKMELEIPKVSVAQNIVANESIEANVVSDKMKDENLQEGMLIQFFIIDIANHYYFIQFNIV
jgi:hypothetical protein